MSKVNLTRLELVSFSQSLDEIKEPEDVSFTAQFKHGISRTKRYIKDEIESMIETLESKAKIIKREKEKLDKELCKVKEGGDVEKEGTRALIPWIDANQNRKFAVVFKLVMLQLYEMGDEEEYQKRFEQILIDEKETVKEVEEYFNKEITITVHSVKVEHVWSGISQEIHDNIYYMIE